MAVYYETEVGLIFRDKLKISTDAIEWKGHVIPLEMVTGVRWGSITQVYGYAVPIHTEYKIAFQSPFYEAKISLAGKKGKEKYEEITESLWRVLATPLSIRILKQLRNGDDIAIGNIKFNDNGVFLKKLGLFREEFFTWQEPLEISSNNGSCIISAKKVKYSASASYIYDNNTHIFDAIVRQFFKNFNPHNPQLSNLLL